MKNYKYLASASEDKTIKIWDLENLECIETLRGHNSGIISIVCDKNYIYSANKKGEIIVWALDTFEEVTKFHCYKNKWIFYSCVDDNFLYSQILHSNYIQKWEINNWEKTTLIDCKGNTSGLIIDDKYLYTLSWFDFTIIDKYNYKILSKQFLEREDNYTLSLDNEFVFVGHSIFSRNTGEKIASLGARLFEIHRVENDDNFVYYSSLDADNISVWKKNDWKMVIKLGVDSMDHFEGLKILSNKIIGGGRSRIYIWSKHDWELIAILRGHSYVINDFAIF